MFRFASACGPAILLIAGLALGCDDAKTGGGGGSSDGSDGTGGTGGTDNDGPCAGQNANRFLDGPFSTVIEGSVGPGDLTGDRDGEPYCFVELISFCNDTDGVLLISADFDYVDYGGSEYCDTFYRSVSGGEWGNANYQDWDDGADDDCDYDRVGMNSGETWTFSLAVCTLDLEDRLMDYRLTFQAN